jgi:cytochrome c-type biogenesis protein CcmH/NrfG
MATTANQEKLPGDTFSMFGDSSGSIEDDPEPSVIGKVASAIGLILLGGLLGISVYYFASTLKPAEPSKPQISEMKAANIPLSAFEENRRDVDKDPAGYLQKNPTPQDAEDYYLVGRGYLLTGDFPKAHSAFVESRNRLGEADPINVQVLKDDLAVAIAVTNDTTIQNIVKKELTPSAANSNANVKR